MFGRRKCNGAKIHTEAWDLPFRQVVEERCVVERRDTERSPGRGTSENAGMSSENYVRIIMVENLRFLEEGSSAQGKPGAKVRPKGVADAHTVEIP